MINMEDSTLPDVLRHALGPSIHHDLDSLPEINDEDEVNTRYDE